MEQTSVDKYRQIVAELDNEFESEGYRSHCKELSDWLMPERGRYLVSNEQRAGNDGGKKRQKIINGFACDAIRILASGLQGGLTSPSRPWFAITTFDQDLNEYEPVRWWTHNVCQRMFNVLARSNFYPTVHGMYAEGSTFATANMIIEEDFVNVIRCYPFTIGEYRLMINDRQRVDGMVHKFSFTARQMAQKFGINSVSETVKNRIDRGGKSLFDRSEVVRIIMPNENLKSGKMDRTGKAFKSIYYEAAGDHSKILRESGYASKPFIAPRWEVVGAWPYGASCPGMMALGDIKQTQKMEEKKLKKLGKNVDPPMNAPMSMKGKGGTIIEGGVNYVDSQSGQQSFTPAYQTDGNIADVTNEIMRVEQRVRQYYFNQLFLSVLNEDKKMTATEVARRYEEKVMVLGAALLQLQHELLDEALDRVFLICANRGMLPPIPDEMRGVPLKIEYISMLAQAQKMVGTAAVEQLASFVGAMAAMNPEVVDKMNFDETVDVYADMIGTAPKVVRADEEVTQIRQQRAQQQQMAQNAQLAAAGAKAAKDLGTTPYKDSNALEALMGGMTR